MNFFQSLLFGKYRKMQTMRFVEDTIKPIVEKYSFGVCTYLADIMGINTSRVRLYFIYTSFLTFGSPVLLYLVTAFWLNIKKYFRRDLIPKQ